MKILITSAASDLSAGLARFLSREHQVLLSDIVDVETAFEFQKCDLSHEEDTNRLVRGCDIIIHLGELPLSVLSDTEEPENIQIDFQTRCTYNLLQAATEEGVSRVIYSSTLRFFDSHDETWNVNEKWAPNPNTEFPTLLKYLGEFVCREFSREGKLSVTCLRLGDLVPDNAKQGGHAALIMSDAIQAFSRAVDSQAGQWNIYHIQSEVYGARFSIEKAKRDLKFDPVDRVEI